MFSLDFRHEIRKKSKAGEISIIITISLHILHNRNFNNGNGCWPLFARARFLEACEPDNSTWLHAMSTWMNAGFGLFMVLFWPSFKRNFQNFKGEWISDYIFCFRRCPRQHEQQAGHSTCRQNSEETEGLALCQGNSNFYGIFKQLAVANKRSKLWCGNIESWKVRIGVHRREILRRTSRTVYM